MSFERKWRPFPSMSKEKNTNLPAQKLVKYIQGGRYNNYVNVEKLNHNKLTINLKRDFITDLLGYFLETWSKQAI